MHITCVIVNYNEWELTQACIDSVAQQDHANVTIILIDNQSPIEHSHIQFSNQSYQLYNFLYKDKSFQPHHPTIDSTFIAIKSSINGGFPCGANIGIKYAQEFLNTDFIWLLNNDTICEPAALSELIRSAAADAIVGSQLVSTSGSPLRSFNYTHPLLGTSHSCLPTDNKRFPYIPFTSALIPMSLFDEIGLLDDRFFLYYDDSDFCIRAAQKHPIQLIISTKSIVYHNESFSSRKKTNDHLCPNWLPVYARKQFMKKYSYSRPLIFFSLFLSFLKRFLSGYFLSALRILILIINEQYLLKQHHYFRSDS